MTVSLRRAVESVAGEKDQSMKNPHFPEQIVTWTDVKEEISSLCSAFTLYYRLAVTEYAVSL